MSHGTRIVSSVNTQRDAVLWRLLFLSEELNWRKLLYWRKGAGVKKRCVEQRWFNGASKGVEGQKDRVPLPGVRER